MMKRPISWQTGLFLLIVAAIVTATAGCRALETVSQPGARLNLDEPFRLQYHFSPPAQWMNDPNGLIYHEGEYHLFYQHNPHDIVWGPMHWGHAVSADLVNWTNLPIALYPDPIGTIFSGSAVIDWENTAGFGEGAMVAVFTHDASGRQMQSLAYSSDNGRTWTKYDGNPVLEPPNNIRNFRDPKVIWHDGGSGEGHWVMMVTAGNIILFFISPDLKTWTPSGGFGLGYGEAGGVWETPDLFELPVDGGPETRWVLTVAIQDNAPAGGSGMQYFVGDFDGEVFTSDNSKETTLWADYGADFYAAQGWNETPDDRQVWAAWMNNWRYAQDIPTTTWRGALTLPRELSLRTTPEGVRLVQKPIAELQELRGEHWSWANETVTAVSEQLADISGDTLEIIADFAATPNMDANRFGIRLHAGNDAQTTIGYATKQQFAFIDRSQSGLIDFNSTFAGVHAATLPLVDDSVRFHILVDRSSVELFANDGLVTITDRIFPTTDSLTLSLFADDGQVVLNALDIYELDAADIRIVAEDGNAP